MSCCSLENTNWTCNHEHFRQRFRSPQAYPESFHLLNKDPFPVPVPPINVIIIMRDSWEAGWAPLYYVTFKGGFTGRNLLRELGRSSGYETRCSRKVRLFCSGLEWCASTEAVQHSLQRCKTLRPKTSVGLQIPKPEKDTDQVCGGDLDSPQKGLQT